MSWAWKPLRKEWVATRAVSSATTGGVLPEPQVGFDALFQRGQSEVLQPGGLLL